MLYLDCYAQVPVRVVRSRGFGTPQGLYFWVICAACTNSHAQMRLAASLVALTLDGTLAAQYGANRAHGCYKPVKSLAK